MFTKAETDEIKEKAAKTLEQKQNPDYFGYMVSIATRKRNKMQITWGYRILITLEAQQAKIRDVIHLFIFSDEDVREFGGGGPGPPFPPQKNGEPQLHCNFVFYRSL